MSETPPPIQKKQKLIFLIVLCSLLIILAVCKLAFFSTDRTPKGKVPELVVPDKSPAQIQGDKYARHKYSVLNRGDKDIDDMHAHGARLRLYEKAFYNSGLVTHHPFKSGRYIVVNPKTFKEIEWGVGAASRARKDRRRRANEERILASPRKYGRALAESAARKMRIEAKRARARGDIIRAAMLELDIDDPSHPLVLARAYNDNSFLIPSSPPQSQGGPYAHLIDPPNVASGKEFSQSQKQEILAENMRNNNGVLRSDLSYERGYEPQQYAPRDDEVHIDHIIPQSKGGTNSFSNAQVLLRIENLQKGATLGNF